MKIKKYKVTLSSPYAVSETNVNSYTDVISIFDALDILWRNMDYEVWNLTITPYWEEVYTDA